MLLSTDPAGAEHMAERIRARVEQGRIRRREGEQAIDSITVSAGVAVQQGDEDGYSLVERADRALYHSKHAGRNRVSLDRAMQPA